MKKTAAHRHPGHKGRPAADVPESNKDRERAHIRELMAFQKSLGEHAPYIHFGKWLIAECVIAFIVGMAIQWLFPSANDFLKFAALTSFWFIADNQVIMRTLRIHEAQAMGNAQKAIDKQREPALADLVVLMNTHRITGTDVSWLNGAEDGQKDYFDSSYLRLRLGKKGKARNREGVPYSGDFVRTSTSA